MKAFWKKTSIKHVENPRVAQPIKRKSIVIHHYCPHTFNAGDHFVIRSIRKHLTHFLPEAVFVPKPCAHNRGWGAPVRLTGPNIEFSNKYADAVIVGGSDQYNNWSLRIRKDEVDKLIPYLYLIGLGVSSKSLGAPPHIDNPRYLEDIRVTNETARLSSVRDKATSKFLRNLGYDKAVVTGCPAMYLFDKPFYLKSEGVVAITFPFPVVRAQNKELFKFLVHCVQGILDMVRKEGLEPVIVCHDDRDVPVAQRQFPNERIFFSNYVDAVIEFYQQVKVVIGSRLHATILASGLGIPFININLDARGMGFSNTFGLESWNVNATDPDLEQALAFRLHQILADDLAPFEAFYQVKSEYKSRFLAFMASVADDIRRGVQQEGCIAN